MNDAKNIYFLSDFHLGAPTFESSLARERKIVSFLDTIKKDAAKIFILGDLFDFWFEYKLVVPKGFVRILGKLAEITDSGIPIVFFVGNHDMWMKDYFQKELNITVHHQPVRFDMNGKIFLIGHGDGLGPGDHGYKFIKKLFRNKWAQQAFGFLPPVVGMGIAHYFSRKSRAQTGKENEVFLGEENEWLVQYCKERLQKEHFDFFIFGHRHLPLDITLTENSRYVNLGDWITYDTFGKFDGNTLILQSHQP